ncbi:FixH family protein [Rapidithrix thailandica]|uniref:FixH family protein n=1 Tax=Rapidithrix thailandica TaxID=413964 RepID=A0AAW9S3A8_9BACT
MKLFNLIIRLTCILFTLSLFTACSDDDEAAPKINTQGLVKIKEGYALGAATKVEIYTQESPFVGFNKFFIALFDSASENVSQEAEIELMPMMQMSQMSHSAPFVNPVFHQETHLYAGAVVFIMPSGEMGKWTLGLKVKNKGKTGMTSFHMEVEEPETERVYSFMNGEEKIFVSLVSPDAPETGVNDFAVAIHKRVGMMDFPAVTDYQVKITPEMPTMGHGSPNNVHPVHMENGIYQGKVNFTMTGLWRIHITLEKGEEVINDEKYFDIEF